jgi:hypothetical protein
MPPVYLMPRKKYGKHCHLAGCKKPLDPFAIHYWTHHGLKRYVFCSAEHRAEQRRRWDEEKQELTQTEKRSRLY